MKFNIQAIRFNISHSMTILQIKYSFMLFWIGSKEDELLCSILIDYSHIAPISNISNIFLNKNQSIFNVKNKNRH